MIISINIGILMMGCRTELPTLPEHLSSPPILSGVCVTRSLGLCVKLSRSLFVLLSFFFWPLWCVSFWLYLWNPQTPLRFAQENGDMLDSVWSPTTTKNKKFHSIISRSNVMYIFHYSAQLTTVSFWEVFVPLFTI